MSFKLIILFYCYPLSLSPVLCALCFLNPHALYSYLSASTGFLVAALQLCQLTANTIIPNAIIPVSAKIRQFNSVLKAKPCNHLCNPTQTIMTPAINDAAPRIMNSLLSIYRISLTFAPLSFRIPISFVRATEVITTRPKRESEPIITDIRLKSIRHLKS